MLCDLCYSLQAEGLQARDPFQFSVLLLPMRLLLSVLPSASCSVICCALLVLLSAVSCRTHSSYSALCLAVLVLLSALFSHTRCAHPSNLRLLLLIFPPFLTLSRSVLNLPIGSSSSHCSTLCCTFPYSFDSAFAFSSCPLLCPLTLLLSASACLAPLTLVGIAEIAQRHAAKRSTCTRFCHGLVHTAGLPAQPKEKRVQRENE